MSVIILHDCEIISYFVNFKDNTILFNLDNNQKVEFINVQLYNFEREVSGSIIFNITDENVDAFFCKNIDYFQKHTNFISPLIGENCIVHFKNYIKQNKYKCYTIDSSYGLYGFIIAQALIVKST